MYEIIKEKIIYIDRYLYLYIYIDIYSYIYIYETELGVKSL